MTLRLTMQRWEGAASLPVMKIQPVSMMDTVNSFKKLSNGTSFGNDKIDSFSMKLATESLIGQINFLTNLSISEGKFANKWRIARVIPLYKGGRKSQYEPDSYRPISLLPVAGKLVEMSVHSQILKHMESNGLWCENNHAYR